MNSQNNEVYFSDILLTMLKKWRMLIACILISAVLLGGYIGYKQVKSMTDKKRISEAEAEYEENLQIYKKQKDQLEKQIESITTSLERTEIDEENCLMLKVDPYNVKRSILAYYIDSEYEIIPSMYYQNINYNVMLANAYNNSIKRMDFDMILRKAGYTDITVDNPIANNNKNIVETSVEGSNSMLYVTILCEDEKQRAVLADEIDKAINKEKELLDTVICEHSITLISRVDSEVTDLDFKAIQEAFANNKDDIFASLDNTKAALENLEEPKLITITKKDIIKKVVKYMAVGVVIGVGIVGLYAIFMSLKHSVLSVDEINRRYGLYHIGSITKKNRLCAADKGILHWLGFSYVPKEEQIDYIVSGIRSLVSEGAVLITSSLGKKVTDQICNEISENIDGLMILNGESVLSSPIGINRKDEYDNVVLVERLNKSNHNDIATEVNLFNKMNKNILGYIITD